MVEDIWMAVDQHANISPQFTQLANYFRERNFYEARKLVNDEILRGTTYVPDHLNFGGAYSQNSNIQDNVYNNLNKVAYNTINDNVYHSSTPLNPISQNTGISSTVNNYQAPYLNPQTSGIQNLGVHSTVSPYQNNTFGNTQIGSLPYQTNPSYSQAGHLSGVVNYAH